MTQTHQTISNQPAALIPDDEIIESMLRRDAAEWRATHIDNNGFSESVMALVAAQPRAPKVTHATQRLVMVGLVALAATLLTLFTDSGIDFLVDATMDLATQTLTPTVLGLFTIMASLTFLAIAAALSER